MMIRKAPTPNRIAILPAIIPHRVYLRRLLLFRLVGMYGKASSFSLPEAVLREIIDRFGLRIFRLLLRIHPEQKINESFNF